MHSHVKKLKTGLKIFSDITIILMGDGNRTWEFNAAAKRYCMSQRGSIALFIKVKTWLYIQIILVISMYVSGGGGQSPRYWSDKHFLLPQSPKYSQFLTAASGCVTLPALWTRSTEFLSNTTIQLLYYSYMFRHTYRTIIRLPNKEGSADTEYHTKQRPCLDKIRSSFRVRTGDIYSN